MLYSMTGFGRSQAECRLGKLTLDVKSINSKQMDLMMRVPSLLRESETEMRAIASNILKRGKVELTLSLERVADSAVSVNEPVVGAYLQQLKRVSSDLGVAEPADWLTLIMRLPDTLRTVQEEIDEEVVKCVLSLTENACDALMDSRRREGNRLESFFKEKIRRIGELLTQIEPFEQERVPKIRKQLEERLARLDSVEYDSGRLEQELIFYIEKLDVTEEKTRLRSHLDYFIDTMTSEDFAGKKLGFIAQEIGREINTLGSKSNDAAMQRIVVMMKDELEQIKEQILNIL